MTLTDLIVKDWNTWVILSINNNCMFKFSVYMKKNGSRKWKYQKHIKVNGLLALNLKSKKTFFLKNSLFLLQLK